MNRFQPFSRPSVSYPDEAAASAAVGQVSSDVLDKMVVGPIARFRVEEVGRKNFLMYNDMPTADYKSLGDAAMVDVRNYLKRIGFQFDRNGAGPPRASLQYARWYRWRPSGTEPPAVFAAALNRFFATAIEQRLEAERAAAAAAAADEQRLRREEEARRAAAAAEARRRAREAAEAAERAHRLDAAAKRLLDAIDAGVPPDEAGRVAGLEFSPDEIRSKMINVAMARAKAPSSAHAGIALASPKLHDTFLNMLFRIGEAFRAFEGVYARKHAERFDADFVSIKETFALGLNSASQEYFGTFPFGYFRLYVRVVPSSEGRIAFNVNFSEDPFPKAKESPPARRHVTDENLQKIVNDALLDSGYAASSLIVRNSGTLIIALNAMFAALQANERAMRELEGGGVAMGV